MVGGGPAAWSCLLKDDKGVVHGWQILLAIPPEVVSNEGRAPGKPGAWRWGPAHSLVHYNV